MIPFIPKNLRKPQTVRRLLNDSQSVLDEFLGGLVHGPVDLEIISTVLYSGFLQSMIDYIKT